MKNIPALLIICLLFLGCSKADSIVPRVPVNVKIVKTDPRYTALNAPGGMSIYRVRVWPELLFTGKQIILMWLTTVAAAISPKNYAPFLLMIRALPLPTHAADQNFHFQMGALLKPLLPNILGRIL